jgi:cytochrome c-type biogenesis protein CcmH
MRKYLVGWLTALMVCTSVFATENAYDFDNEAQRQSFKQLTAELRCPMCQNQNIADSDAMIAHDMRRKVYSLVKQGKSNDEVINFMKSRYGDFVHYKPPVTPVTLWLWALPALFVCIGLFVITRRRPVASTENKADKLAQAEAMLEKEK